MFTLVFVTCKSRPLVRVEFLRFYARPRQATLSGYGNPSSLEWLGRDAVQKHLESEFILMVLQRLISDNRICVRAVCRGMSVKTFCTHTNLSSLGRGGKLLRNKQS